MSQTVTCPKCKDHHGWIEQREEGEYWIQCSCIEQKRTERIMRASQITEEFQKIGFRGFQTDGKPSVIEQAYECAMAYYQSFEDLKNKRQNSISLLGNPGSGKTHLLMAVANNMMRKKNIRVQYFPYVEGFNNLKDDFSVLEAKIDRMQQTDVLFIDDLFKPTRGEARATVWQVEQMYSIINHRYLNHKPIMITSEWGFDELFDIDEALGSRIYEMCKSFSVLIKGDRKKLNHRMGD